MSTYCVYHQWCSDGTAALWVVQQVYPEVLPWGAHHFSRGELPPVTKEDDLIFVDFCYSLERMLQLAQSAQSLLVIDHHESSRETLDELRKLEGDDLDVEVVWSNEASACQLAWDHYFGKPEPLFLTHISDRDRWVWTHHKSRDFTAAVNAQYDRTPETIKILARLTDEQYDRLVAEGAVINRIQDELIRRLALGAPLLPYKEWRVWVCETPLFISDVGAVLAERERGDFAMVWHYNLVEKRTIVALRGSKSKGINLVPIAQSYGGGGHPMACGFSIKGTIDQLFEEEKSEP